MKKIFLALLLPSSLYSFAQPAIQWEKCLGGSSNDYGYCIQQTRDSGYVVIGITGSTNGNVTGFHGGTDTWIAKLDRDGTIQWENCYGGTGGDEGTFIRQTTDEGYIFAGSTTSNDGDVIGFHGTEDVWVVKLNDTGVIQWSKCYGGSGDDWASSIQQTTDGGYIIAGFTTSNDGDVSGIHGGGDCWVVKITDSGAIQWQKCYGGANDESATSIVQTSDSGYVFTANTYSNDGDVTGMHGIDDYWVVKLDTGGAIQWAKCYGGSQDEEPSSIIQTLDGGYAVAGVTGSSDGDVSGNNGNYDYWIIKLSDTGALQWQICLGGTNDDEATSIIQTNDTNYVIAGYAFSHDGEVTGNIGAEDYWIVKLDAGGNIIWKKNYGGGSDDRAFSIVQTFDNGYAIAGYTNSTSGEVTGLHGSWDDYWVVKLAPDTTTGIKEINKAIDLVNVYPNPFNNLTTIKINGTVNNATLYIYDVLGNIMKNVSFGNNKQIIIDREQLERGMYFYQLVQNNSIMATGKLIIE